MKNEDLDLLDQIEEVGKIEEEITPEEKPKTYMDDLPEYVQDAEKELESTILHDDYGEVHEVDIEW